MPKKSKIPVVWSPQPKQEEALTRTEFEVLYGGARGGGKTDTGIAWLLYPVWEWLKAIKDKDTAKAERLGRYRALIIRKNADDLKDWIDRAQFIYTQIFGHSVQFVGKPTEIKFGDKGPVFRTGHLKDSDAYQKYQGHEYQRQLIEELTQIPAEEYYEDLISSCRSTIPEIEPQIFATTNPDGPGFYWVKDRFKIPDWPPEEPISSLSEVKLPNGETRSTTRVFIRALLDDNQRLKEKDVSYEVRLASMKDESRRKAWLLGFWGEPIIEGVIFNEQLKQIRADNRLIPIAFDPKYPVYTYWDIGRDATSIYFMQLIGNWWHLIDFYENSGQGFDHYSKVLRDKETTLGYWYDMHFGPHDLAKTSMDNETIWQIAERHNILFTIVPKATTFDAIEATKIKLPRLKIDSVTANKEQPNKRSLMQRLTSFRRDWDDDKQVFKDTYIHDWASHAGTALFYWGLSPDPIYNPNTEEFGIYSSTFN